MPKRLDQISFITTTITEFLMGFPYIHDKVLYCPVRIFSNTFITFFNSKIVTYFLTRLGFHYRVFGLGERGNKSEPPSLVENSCLRFLQWVLSTSVYRILINCMSEHLQYMCKVFKELNACTESFSFLRLFTKEATNSCLVNISLVY